MPFRALGLSPNLCKAIQDAGYTEPTPIQSAAIPQILADHDLIGIAQTGTGKTAAFALPILAKLENTSGTAPKPATRALVIAPTRELAAQIQEDVRAYGRHLPIRVASVFGGVGERPQIQALRSAVDIVIATPGRLLDLMGQRCADFSALQFLVLDEADRMLDMGFLPSIRQIVRSLPRQRQTLLFCATLGREIEALTREFLRSPKVVQIGRRSSPAESVTQLVYEISPQRKMGLLTHLLDDPAMNMVLLFTRTKHGADRVARHLEHLQIPTATLHSNRSQSQRLRALKDFKSGHVRVLVATNIAARGIDVDGISHVVNYDFPSHPEDYVHRIGRTGRAHAVGDAISFVTPEDRTALRSLERFIGRGIVRKHAEGFAAIAPQIAAPRPHEHSSRAPRTPSHSHTSTPHSPPGQDRRRPKGRPQGRGFARSHGPPDRGTADGSSHTRGFGRPQGALPRRKSFSRPQDRSRDVSQGNPQPELSRKQGFNRRRNGPQGPRRQRGFSRGRRPWH